MRKRTAFLVAARGAFECQTGLRANSNDLKKWCAEDVEEYIDEPTAAFSISCLLEPIRVLSAQVKEIEKRALKQAKLRPEFASLETVWGIGKILALTIMYEVGEIERFRKVGNFASYCRLVKTARMSAGKRKGSGNRRNGNPHLSWAFSEAAYFAVRYHDEARRYFQRKRSKTNWDAEWRQGHWTFNPGPHRLNPDGWLVRSSTDTN
ncbi:MAG: transposase [Holophagae bacterium]